MKERTYVEVTPGRKNKSQTPLCKDNRNDLDNRDSKSKRDERFNEDKLDKRDLTIKDNKNKRN